MKAMKRSGIIFSTVLLLCAACTPDEAGMLSQMNDLDKRLTTLEQSLAAINEQVEALGTLTQGNVITSLSQDSEGNYVITYKGADDKEYTVVAATKEQMINVPQLAVTQDPVEGIYYWTVVDPDGTESPLLDAAGNRVPVSGSAPRISTDANGYWTVGGVQILDGEGRPILARDGNSCIFQSIRVNEDGDMEVVLGGGKVIVLPMQQLLNLTLSQPINGATPTSFPATLDITYAVTGSAADGAIVAISGAYGLTATQDRELSRITLTFPAGFTSGYVVVVAYDLGTHSVIRPVFFGEGTTPPDPPTPPTNIVEIGTASELVAFATAVNSQDGSESKTAILTGDIDLSGVSSWKPIGKATSAAGTWSGTPSFAGSFTYSGPAFRGTFNGQGYTISGFNTTSAGSGVWGLFGVLDGATVKNVNVGGAMTVSATGELAAGVIAGAMVNSTIENCSSAASVSIGTSTSGYRMIAGGIAGFVYSKEGGRSILRNCTRTGSLTSGTKSGNTTTGFDCVAYGGIAALSTSTNSQAPRTLITDCTNSGNMNTSNALARCSGIIANCTFTDLMNCSNSGNQRNTGSDGRIGNVASYVYASQVSNCSNSGDLTTTKTDTECGGVLGLVGGGATEISGGGNTGNITSACTTVGTASGDNVRIHRGLLFANLASFGHVDDMTAGGSLWNYNGGNPIRVALNQSNYMDYIGRYTDANASKITNIHFDAVVPTAGISTAAELAEFASLVNSGSSYAKFQAADGSVNLLMDIDLSSVSASWTPIGVATASTDDIDVTVNGHPFTGVFDGGGHNITGFNPTKTTGSDGTFGLFGVLSGATVSNFTLSGTMSVSATAKSHVGAVAGVCYKSSISSVTSNVTITSTGTTESGQRFAIGGIVGLTANDGVAASSITSCTNGGSANIDCGSNVNNGLTSVMYGGIVGFSTGQGANLHSMVSNCVNNGNMTVRIGRCAGIVGTCKQYTKINACTNNGTQKNSSAKNRLGQITCELGSNCRMDGCINNGDIIASGTAAANDDIRVGGLVGAMSNGTIQGGASNGRVITNGHEENAGLIFAYISNCTAVKDVAVKGLIGKYASSGSHVMKNVTAANFDTWAECSLSSSRMYSYLGCANATKYTKVTGCTFVP